MSEDWQKVVIAELNKSRSAELGAISQYMNHHYEAKGMDSVGVRDVFRKQAIDEMRHAEALAERISALGGIPTLQIAPVKRCKTVQEMLRADLEIERRAIERYKKQIKICEELGDTSTRRLLEDILMDEEAHADYHASLT